MKVELNDNTLTLYPVGHVDSKNAGDFERDVMAALDEAPGATVVVDVAGLEYISSAGLRVFMKLMRRAGGTLRVINASPDVYEIFEVTGFSELMDVSKALREVSIEGCEIVGKGGNGTVYRLDEDTIVKVYGSEVDLEDIQRERDFARAAFIAGVPSAIAYDVVRVGDNLGVVFEMIKSDTLGHAMRDNPDQLEEYVDKYVALVKELHGTQVEKGTFSDIHAHLHGYADKLDEWCTEDEIALLHEIIDAIPHARTLVHGDLHPGNIMVQDGELLLIDMPDLTTAPPVLDLIAIFRDLISGPSSPDPRAKAQAEQSVGMPVEMIVQVGNMFFAKYTGITDPAELGEYLKRIGLLYSFNVVFMVVAGGPTGRAFADKLIGNVLRQVVVPNAQAIKGLFQVM